MCVHCHIGSLEIQIILAMQAHCVHCHIGSLETLIERISTLL